jgi:hypothetical protein
MVDTLNTISDTVPVCGHLFNKEITGKEYGIFKNNNIIAIICKKCKKDIM